jgi:hypothetical protein
MARKNIRERRKGTGDKKSEEKPPEKGTSVKAQLPIFGQAGQVGMQPSSKQTPTVK